MDSLVVSPNSWFHEQKNFKYADALNSGLDITSGRILSREIGHNSYKRIKDCDFSKAYGYWNKTKTYWSDVVWVWEKIHNSRSSYTMKKRFNGKKLFMYHFENAKNQKVLNMTQVKRRILLEKLILNFIKNYQRVIFVC